MTIPFIPFLLSFPIEESGNGTENFGYCFCCTCKRWDKQTKRSSFERVTCALRNIAISYLENAAWDLSVRFR